MLIPAAIVGVIVFFYGCATVDDNIPRYAADIVVNMLSEGSASSDFALHHTEIDLQQG